MYVVILATISGCIWHVIFYLKIVFIVLAKVKQQSIWCKVLL
jgi:hypothetical protein